VLPFLHVASNTIAAHLWLSDIGRQAEISRIDGLRVAGMLAEQFVASGNHFGLEFLQLGFCDLRVVRRVHA